MDEWVGLLVLLLVIGGIVYLILMYFGILARVTDYTDKTKNFTTAPKPASDGALRRAMQLPRPH